MRDIAQLLLLDRDAIAALLTTQLALTAVRDAFTLHSRREGRVFPVVRETLADSDVIITATPGDGALFNMEAVQPGSHITAVGADTRGKRELPDGLLARSRVVVDDRAQAQALGEMQWAEDVACLELGDVLTGSAFLRAADDVTVFDMTGLALQDLVLGEYLYGAAVAQGLGNSVAWPW